MKRIYQYKITIKQLASDSDLDHDDLIDNPSGTVYLEAVTENAALDEFHETIPISCLDHFEITIKKTKGQQS